MSALQAPNLDPWVVHRKRGVPEPLGQPAGALIGPRILADSLRGWILLLLAKPIGALASCYIDCHVKVSRGIVFSMGSYIVPVLWERMSSTPQYLDLDPGNPNHVNKTFSTKVTSLRYMHILYRLANYFGNTTDKSLPSCSLVSLN